MPVNLLSALIALYRIVISPLKPSCCRYIPTCSDYARRAVEIHGPLRGSWLTMRRIMRCHPFGGHGLDEVPPATTGKDTR